MSDGGYQAFDGIIVSARIVMSQCNPLHTRMRGELQHVFDRAMPPTDLFRIFFRSVLSIVDEEISPLHKLGVA